MATTFASPAIPHSPLLRFAQKHTKSLLSLPSTQKRFSNNSSRSKQKQKQKQGHGKELLRRVVPTGEVHQGGLSRGKWRNTHFSRKVSAKEVQEMIKGERSVPLVVDFYATWCGPCVLMAQELEMLAVEYENNALFVKVDTDDEYEFARDMQVRGLPTLYFISPDPNKDAIRTEGLVPPEMIKNIIDNEMIPIYGRSHADTSPRSGGVRRVSVADSSLASPNPAPNSPLNLARDLFPHPP
uniref:Thioredoxin-like protein CITRX, chloroplastic n=1 Tax=Ananas comosus var. bracteatus TaxID=296719 RepID=A0A6V7QYW1_ANACO